MKFSGLLKFAALASMAGVLTLTLFGCGSTVSNTAFTQGNWAFTATSTAPAINVSSSTFVIGGNLLQSGATLSGTLTVNNSGCISPQTLTFTGTVKGSDITLTSAAFDGNVISVTASGTKDSLSGNYTITGGCADTGTITASAVPSISGTWNGLISNAALRAQGYGIADATVSVALTQAASASENGSFALTGTLTYTNSICSLSGTISLGSMVGDFIQQVAGTTNDKDETNGQFSYEVVRLDSVTAPKNMSGTYIYTSGGVCSDQSTSLTLTKQ